MATNKAKGMLSKAPDKGKKKGKKQGRITSTIAGTQYGRNEKRRQVGKDANALLDQREARDLYLGDLANRYAPRIDEAFKDPFSYEGLPDAPRGDAAERQRIEDETYARFEARNAPIFQKQLDDFDQQMANRGIPMGSALYNDQKHQLLQSQADARSDARARAIEMGGQEYERSYNIGDRARQRGIDERLQERNMPITEYNMLQASMSGMPFNEQAANNAQQAALNVWQAKQMPRGGGGGGGGAGPLYAQYGFSSPMEFDAWKREQARADQMWEWQNNPANQKPKQPNPWAGVAGGILGAAAGGIFGSESFGKKIWGP